MPKKLQTDQNRLRQILINLISNAIKYTHKGYVRIKARLNSQKSRVCISVEDSGVGISESDQIQLFKAYVKIMRNRNLNKEGCGLGLTISKNLAEALGGALQVNSQVGVGSVFTVELPLHSQDLLNMRKQQSHSVIRPS